MAKKKNLLMGITEEEMLYIEQKKGRNYEVIDEYKNQIKLFSNMKLDISCKNEKQKAFLNQLKNTEKEICFGVGSPGTGKSYISLAYALKALKNGDVENITMIIPTAPAGGKDMELGFLKGDFEEKVRPFLEADRATITKILKLSGNVDASVLAGKLINEGYIKYEFINYLLGKTLDNSIILVNEAEQYTKDNMRLILTRLGENSRFIITGDANQVNRRSILNKSDSCGLSYVVEKLKDMDEVSITEFGDNDIVRNKLITKIIDRLT